MNTNTNPDHMTDYPAVTGDVITERHARLCREEGHKSWTVDGKDTGRCPRCGDMTKEA